MASLLTASFCARLARAAIQSQGNALSGSMCAHCSRKSPWQGPTPCSPADNPVLSQPRGVLLEAFVLLPHQIRSTHATQFVGCARLCSTWWARRSVTLRGYAGWVHYRGGYARWAHVCQRHSFLRGRPIRGPREEQCHEQHDCHGDSGETCPAPNTCMRRSHGAQC